MIHYVLGFAFTQNRDRVALIWKMKGPPSVVGKLNGIGGKVEPDEIPRQAMVREFREETGVEIAEEEWKQFAVLKGQTWKVHCFCAFTDRAKDVRTVETEEVWVINTRTLRDSPHIVANLPVLLSIALDQSGIQLPVRLHDISQ